MPKNKKNERYYLIESAERKWSYGAFPHTEDGLKEAKKYLRNLQKKTKEKLEIVAK
tara:strand:- start:419 stop:586 length:168 start_codon:yes stop_codon:yes gene_type:complete